jgi:hypothetical protein
MHGGQVDPDGAVLQDLGLALVFVQRLQAAAPGDLQGGLHVAGLVAVFRVDVEVALVLVYREDDLPIRGLVTRPPRPGSTVESKAVQIRERALVRNVLVSRDERSPPNRQHHLQAPSFVCKCRW